MNSSPGFCDLSRYGTTIGEILKYDGLGYDQDRLDMFKYLVTARIQTLLEGSDEADDIRLFVKQEPHSQSKLREGRYRLISAVSLVDTMVDRMLFGDLMDAVLASAGKTPTMIGWVPVLGGYRLLRRKMPGRVMCIDKSSWDWTVPHWMTRIWLDIILGLCNDAPSFWEPLVRKRFRMLFEQAIFQFPDGIRVRQEVGGIMKSGCYLTILLNSLGQSVLHYMVYGYMGRDMLSDEPYCMGDDTVQPAILGVDQYLARIGELGFLVKEVKEQNWIEFAGFMIDETTWPVYWRKHIYRLQHADDDVLEDTLFTYMLLYSAQPAMFDYLRALMLKVNPKRALGRSILKGFIAGGKFFTAAVKGDELDGCLGTDQRLSAHV